MSRSGSAICAILAVTAIFADSFAQCTENQILDPVGGDWFGSSLAMQGNIAVVGASEVDCPGDFGCGAVYIYERVGGFWTLTQILTAADAGQSHRFGEAVDLDGDVIIIGARDLCPGGSDGCRAAYIFRRSGSLWVQEQKLALGESLGRNSVAVSGNTAIVGIPWRSCSTGGQIILYCGVTQVFRFNGVSWVQQQTLAVSPPTFGAYFGTSISIESDRLAVGAPGYGQSGAVFVYRLSGSWMLEQVLTGTSVNGLIGSVVVLKGNLILTGSSYEDCLLGEDCGSAFIFRRTGSNWALEDRLTALDESPDTGFGFSLALTSEYAIVGAPFADCDVNTYRGAAYLFRHTPSEWVQCARLRPSDETHFFGAAVSIDGDSVFVSNTDLDFPGKPPCFTCAQVYTFNNTDTEMGCFGECQINCPSGPVTFLEPPPGIVDARQPHPVNSLSPAQGISTFTVSAPPGASADCWSVCETNLGQPTNSIQSVIPAGSSYTITLSRPITPGAVMTVTYTDDACGSASAYYTAHPANVNGDSKSSPIDILRLVDCLNDVSVPVNCPWGLFSQDINHDGASTPQDILTVIDLLNGADTFDRWNATNLPIANSNCP